MGNWLIFLVVALLLLSLHRRKKRMLQAVMRRRNQRGKRNMNELLCEFIGKNCILYTLDAQVSGVVEEIGDKWVRLRAEPTKGGSADVQVLNLDYITRVRLYPKNKKGKNVSVVLD